MCQLTQVVSYFWRHPVSHPRSSVSASCLVVFSEEQMLPQSSPPGTEQKPSPANLQVSTLWGWQWRKREAPEQSAQSGSKTGLFPRATSNIVKGNNDCKLGHTAKYATFKLTKYGPKQICNTYKINKHQKNTERTWNQMLTNFLLHAGFQVFACLFYTSFIYFTNFPWWVCILT